MFTPRIIRVLFKVMVCFIYLLVANSCGKAEELQIMIYFYMKLFYLVVWAFLLVPLFMIEEDLRR